VEIGRGRPNAKRSELEWLCWPRYTESFGVPRSQESPMSKQRLEVHFRGRVQGVGFRWTVQRIANRFEVVGYVRNLSDGRVQLVAEGDLEALECFVGSVEAEMARYIAESSVMKMGAIDEFERFEIRY
jgi:acylphosphatase